MRRRRRVAPQRARVPAAGAGLSVVTIVVVRASVTRPLSAMAGWTKALKAGKVMAPPDVADAGVFGPLARSSAASPCSSCPIASLDTVDRSEFLGGGDERQGPKKRP